MLGVTVDYSSYRAPARSSACADSCMYIYIYLGFPKIGGGSLVEVLIIRTIVFWGRFWVPLCRETTIYTHVQYASVYTGSLAEPAFNYMVCN